MVHLYFVEISIWVPKVPNVSKICKHNTLTAPTSGSNITLIIISSISNNQVADISDFVIADMRLRIKQYTIELKRTNNTRLKLQDVNINIAKELTQIITRLITCQKGNDNAYKYLIHVIDYFTILTHFEV